MSLTYYNHIQNHPTTTKTAGLSSLVSDGVDWMVKNVDKASAVSKHLGVAAQLAVPVLAGGFLLKRGLQSLQGDIKRKALIEDLSLNDPVLKNVDKSQLMEWYATMHVYAPSMTADKTTVREVLQGFARFGKPDMQTLKTLAETERQLVSSANDRAALRSIIM